VEGYWSQPHPSEKEQFMAKTKEANRSGPYVSPTAAAPVLVGFDGAEGGRDALELGRVLSSIRDARCIVAMPDAENLASEAREALGDPDAEVRDIGILSPAMMLVEAAERETAGTLVVGSTRRGRIGRALVGSTAEQVLHKAPCEVVVAPRGYASGRHEGLAKIVAAVDGTPESKVALGRAEDLARRRGQLSRSSSPPTPSSPASKPNFHEMRPRRCPTSWRRRLARSTLSPTGKKVDSGWRQVVRTIADALAAACAPDVDLLVAGSRRPWDRFLLGSVTKHLIAEAPCPVLVVPRAR
jgi:nucleotide-binding universal stress UspA family protein